MVFFLLPFVHTFINQKIFIYSLGNSQQFCPDISSHFRFVCQWSDSDFPWPATRKQICCTVSLTAVYVRERQSERSVRASQIISPVLMHFLTDKLSLHTPPPQLTFVLSSLCGDTRETWLIEKCRQKNNVSTCCLAEVSISGTVNTGPPSIAGRNQTSHRSPNKCHRSQSSLYFHCA